MKQQTDRLTFWLAVLSCMFALSMGGGIAYAQSGPLTISGKVYDQNDEPVVGAGVLIKGTNTGAVTDLDGFFTLTVPGEETVIVVSSI